MGREAFGPANGALGNRPRPDPPAHGVRCPHEGTVLAFTFYFVFAVGEARLMTVLTLAFAIIATIVHVKMGRRDRIDSLIDRGP
jgi:hypothetical protein